VSQNDYANTLRRHLIPERTNRIRLGSAAKRFLSIDARDPAFDALTAANITGATLVTPNIGAATGTSLQLTGSVSVGAGASSLNFSARSAINSGADGRLNLRNAAGNDFDRLTLGPETSSFPSLKRSPTALQLRLGDDTGFTALDASDVSIDGANGQACAMSQLSESVTLSGATTAASAAIFPAGSLGVMVVYRVTTPITGATSFDLGVSGAAARYFDDAALTGTGVSGVASSYPGATALLFTANGSNFTGGVVRVTVYFIAGTAPTS
jgi:hypothetical protein